MKIQIDDDVQSVVEFMQQNIQANKLVSVADTLPQIAKLLWSQIPQEPCRPSFISVPKPDCDPLLSTSTE